MKVKSLKIKNESMFYPNDMIQLNNFDCQLLKINKRENRENNNIYYISYKINKPEHDMNSANNLYFVVDHLYGKIEKTSGSKDRYLVINEEDSLMNEKNIFNIFNNINLFLIIIIFFIIYGILLLIKLNIQEEMTLCLMIMK